MKNEQQLIAKLSEHGIRTTANRLLLLAAMLEFGNRAFSLQDLELKQLTIDRSTIFRIIMLFEEHCLIHSFDDGSGSQKYSLCHHESNDHHSDNHMHFYCESCHKAFCFHDIATPEFVLPMGFVSSKVNFVVKGICKDCSQRKKV